MDWFVLLTPVLVLAVILLLGFTGCDVVFPLDPPPPPLMLAVRVPKEFTVVASRIRWQQPGATTIETAFTLQSRDEGAEFVLLFHTITNPATGTWSADCRLEVQEGAQQAADQSPTATFTLDGDEEGVATTALFVTLGRPSNNNFRVQFFGLVSLEA